MPRQTPSRSRNPRSLLLGIICALLVVYTATVQVAHHHDAMGASHADCALCLVAHTGIVLHAPVVVPAPTEHADDIEVPAKPAPLKSFVFSFYSRPPPAEPASV
ncbi:MAG: hypothetical protein WBX19_02090 [Terracidiphilus sp.]